MNIALRYAVCVELPKNVFATVGLFWYHDYGAQILRHIVYHGQDLRYPYPEPKELGSVAHVAPPNYLSVMPRPPPPDDTFTAT